MRACQDHITSESCGALLLPCHVSSTPPSICRLSHAFTPAIFSSSAYISAKCKRLDAFVPPPRNLCDDLFALANVKGDGRCGFRALAKYLGISWRDVMGRLVHHMLSSSHFSSNDIVRMIAASDPQNPCDASCWLSGKHISLLAASEPVWFPGGIYVVKLDCLAPYLHFGPDASVEPVFLLPPRACVLGLLTRKSFHFLLATQWQALKERFCPDHACLDITMSQKSRDTAASWPIRNGDAA